MLALPVARMRACLCEYDRPDLADILTANAVGSVALGDACQRVAIEDVRVLARAAWIAYLPHAGTAWWPWSSLNQLRAGLLWIRKYSSLEGFGWDQWREGIGSRS